LEFNYSALVEKILYRTQNQNVFIEYIQDITDNYGQTKKRNSELKNIIPKVDERQWVRLNLFKYFWIQIIKDLRALDLNTKIIGDCVLLEEYFKLKLMLMPLIF